MNQLITLVVNGLSLGFIYALVALGFVLIFKATGVINFAHASVLLLGAYVIARANEGLAFLPAVLVGVAAAAVVAVLIDVVLIRRIRGADLGTLAILTLGVDIIMVTELTRRIGSDVPSIRDPWGSSVVTLAGIDVPESRIAAAIVAVLLLGAFMAAFKFSDWGIAMRASASDGETAALMGIRLSRVSVAAWALGGALAAVGGLFFTTFPSPGIEASVGLTALGAIIPAAILGGLDSTGGAVVGGLIIGVVATLTAGYQSELAFLGRGLGEVTPYVVMLLVLLVRPSGLFGTRDVTRV